MKKHIIDIITKILSNRGPIENFAKITHLLFCVPRVGNSCSKSGFSMSHYSNTTCVLLFPCMVYYNMVCTVLIIIEK